MSGNFDTREFDISAANAVPVALFAAKDDKIATVEDARLLRDQLHNSLVHYQEIDGGQTTFLIGKEMAYFTEDVVSLLQKFHPVWPGQSTVTIDEYHPQAKI